MSGNLPKGNGLMADKSRRLVDYLRVSVTDRCNLRCSYCMPSAGIVRRSHADILTYEEIEAFVSCAVELGISKVRITGGEPLVRRDLSRLVKMLSAIPGLSDLALTTNGSLLEEHAAELGTAGLRRVNISIDSLDPERFCTLSGGGSLERALAGLDAAVRHGFDPVKINVVLLEGVEREIADYADLLRRLPVHVRFIEFMPIGGARGGHWKAVHPRAVEAALRELGRLEPAEGPQGWGPANYYSLDGSPGTFGFISSMSSHFCSECNRLRLTADGNLRSCLFSADEVPIRQLIAGDRGGLRSAITQTIQAKAFDRRLGDPGARTMSEIGG